MAGIHSRDEMSSSKSSAWREAKQLRPGTPSVSLHSLSRAERLVFSGSNQTAPGLCKDPVLLSYQLLHTPR